MASECKPVQPVFRPVIVPTDLIKHPTDYTRTTINMKIAQYLEKKGAMLYKLYSGMFKDCSHNDIVIFVYNAMQMRRLALIEKFDDVDKSTAALFLDEMIRVYQ
jgi:hypothetical protein